MLDKSQLFFAAVEPVVYTRYLRPPINSKKLKYHSLITELTIAVISYQNPKYPTIKNFDYDDLKH